MNKQIKTQEDWQEQFNDNKIKIKLPKLKWKPGKGPLSWLLKKIKK